MSRQHHWLASAISGLIDQAESQRDRDKLELLRIVDRQGLENVLRWVRSVHASTQPVSPETISDPRR